VAGRQRHRTALRGGRVICQSVEQRTRFRFVINLATAKTLGLTVPPAILARADEVIE
jgi:putative ABC transport system substrate-binding protein